MSFVTLILLFQNLCEAANAGSMSVFDVVPTDINYSQHNSMLSFVMLLARYLILLERQTKVPPTHQNIIRNVKHH